MPKPVQALCRVLGTIFGVCLDVATVTAGSGRDG